MFEEVEQARQLTTYDVVMAVGSVGADCPFKLTDWVSYHGYLFPQWFLARQPKQPQEPWGQGQGPRTRLWTSTAGRHVMQGEQNMIRSKLLYDTGCDIGGSSARIAVHVALDRLNCTKVVLAGIPMSSEAGQYDTGAAWEEASLYRHVWERDQQVLAPYLRSMSGWTQQVFGAPTREWLCGTESTTSSSVSSQ